MHAHADRGEQGARVSNASNAAPGSADYRPSVNRHTRALIARIQKNQDDVEAIRALEAHYVETGDHPSLVNLLEGWGDTLKEPRSAADAYVNAADAALSGLADRARARTLYERALSRDPSHALALDRALRLLGDSGDFDREKQVLKYVAYQLEQTSGDTHYLASVLYRLGQVYETRFGEPGKAAANYRRAIEINPKLVPAIVAARRIYADVGNTNAIALLYDFEIEATPAPEDKRSLLIALAELREQEQDDLDSAVLALRRALKLMPSDVEALRKLGEVLQRRSERHADPNGEFAISDRKRAAEVFYQVGRTVPERNAQSYLARALELHPGHEKAAIALRELSERTRGDEPTQELQLDAIDPVEPVESIDPVVQVAVTQYGVTANAPVQADATLQTPPIFAEETAGTVAEPVVPVVARPAQPVRDSVEEWLHDDRDLEEDASLSTGELLPLEVSETTDAEMRPSSLPPRELVESSGLVFPPTSSLRAPRVPSATPRRSTPPPPPPSAAGRAVRSVPPPPVVEAQVPTPMPPPPAFAEIPGAGSDDLTPARAQRPSPVPLAPSEASDAGDTSVPALHSLRQAEPTLIAWRLTGEPARKIEPSAVEPGIEHRAEPRSAPAAEASAAPTVAAVVPATPAAAPRAAKRSSLPAAPAPVRASSAPRAPSGQNALRSTQDQRVSELMRAAREHVQGVPAPTPPVLMAAHPEAAAAQVIPDLPLMAAAIEPVTAPVAAVHEPLEAYRPSPQLEARAPDAVPAPAPAPAPVPSTPAAPVTNQLPPPRACLVDGELLHDPARATIEVNLGANTDSNFYVGFSNRLADGGIFVATYAALPIGTDVELLVTLPGGFGARAHGRVRLVRDTVEPFGDDIPGMCVEIEALSLDALNLFERFAKKRAPLFIED